MSNYEAPVVSVFMLTCNQEDYIGQAIESIPKQKLSYKLLAALDKNGEFRKAFLLFTELMFEGIFFNLCYTYLYSLKRALEIKKINGVFV